MKQSSNKLLRFMKCLFGISFFIIVLTFILGQIFLENEGGTKTLLAGAEGYNCRVFESEWTRLMPDGTNYEVEVPGVYEAYPGEAVTVVTMLPHTLEDQTWLCFEGYWQDMEFFVDGVLRERYSTESTRPFGKNSATTYVFVELFREDAGKELKVVTSTLSSYTGTMNTVYVGDKYGIWLTFFDRYGVAFILEFVLLILSCIGLIFCFVLWGIYRKNFDYVYLCSALFFVAAWRLSESQFRQLLFSNVSAVTAISFLSLMMLPVTVIFYINEIQNQRYRKWHMIPILAGGVNLIITVCLQFFGIRDFQECLLGSHLIIGISSISIIVTIAIDCAKREIREYAMVAIGLLVAVLSAAVEMAAYYVAYYNLNGVPLSLGLIFLFFMASTKTVRELLAESREKQRAIHANEAKARFLANMSHEIRTPINSILGMNEMILRESQEDDVLEYAGNIEKSGKLLLTLISDVLDFSKIEAGEVEIYPVEYDVHSLIFDTVKAMHARATKKNLKLKVDAEESLPKVLRGDEFRIRQILNNLLSNAVKYTKTGTVKLTVNGTNDEDGNFLLVISVKDTGIGIRQEDLSKLFSSFTRLDESKNRTIEGTGLGLNITKLLIDLMQGDISVSSEYGKGSEFVVRLPQEIVDAAPMGVFKEKYGADTGSGRRHKSSFKAPQAEILVVDDNEINLAVIRGLLKGTEIVIDTALGGLEALEKSRQKVYDIILLDHMMPDPDGVETLRMLRKEADNPNQNTKVVALTANALAGCREEYMAAGFDDYLSKPIEVEKLEDLICSLLPKEKIEDFSVKEEKHS
nr:response regulator [Lachnospiraceae bacterium]